MWASTYDAVGNRKQKTSTLPGFPGGLLNYNANDQLATDTYDADGNTIGSGANTGANGYVYDFENHLIQQAGISIVYDGDGNRASKTVGGVTTTYLVDTQSPTGYAQVLQETFNGARGTSYELSHTYVYGLEQISQRRYYFANNQGNYANAYYVHDGHGSVRALTDPTGAVTDTYDYDAFGNLIHSTGTTQNVYLYSGEQYDPDLNLYYNRARYLNTSTGTFWTMDTYEGFDQDPGSLHKYLYVEADPTTLLDRTGHFLVSTTIYGNTVHAKVTAQFLQEFKDGRADESIDSILGTDAGISGALRPDLVSPSTGEAYEIASVLGAEVRFWKLLDEVYTFNKYDPLKRTWTTGSSFIPEPLIKLDPLTFAIVDPPVAGVIVYTVVNAGEIYFLAAIAVKSMLPQLETETGTALTFAAEGVF
jgi:RHS repeat-associated protein